MAIKFSWSRRAEADGLDRADPGPRQNGGSGRVLPKRRAAPLETVADRREAVEQQKAAAPFRRGGGTRRMEPGGQGPAGRLQNATSEKPRSANCSITPPGLAMTLL